MSSTSISTSSAVLAPTNLLCTHRQNARLNVCLYCSANSSHNVLFCPSLLRYRPWAADENHTYATIRPALEAHPLLAFSSQSFRSAPQRHNARNVPLKMQTRSALPNLAPRRSARGADSRRGRAIPSGASASQHETRMRQATDVDRTSAATMTTGNRLRRRSADSPGRHCRRRRSWQRWYWC